MTSLFNLLVNVGARGTSQLRGLFSVFGQGLKSIVNTHNAFAAYLTFLSSRAIYNATLGANASLESQRLALASIIDANLDLRDSYGKLMPAQQSFATAMDVSNLLLERFRKDTLTLPGSAKEALEIASLAANPVFAARGTLDDLKTISEQAMVFGKTYSIDMAQTARDVQFILSGNAGSEQRTFVLLRSYLGMAEDFNKLTAPERLARLKAAYNQYVNSTMIEAASNTWEGLTSSIGEFLDFISTRFSGPLFERIKGTMRGLVDYFQANRDRLADLAGEWGTKLADGIYAVGEGVLRFGQYLYGLRRDAGPVLAWLANFWEAELRPRWEAGRDLAVAVFNSLIPAAQAFWSGFWPVISPFLDLFTSISNTIWTLMVPALNGITGWITTHQDEIDTFARGLGAVVGIFTGGYGSVVAFTGALSALALVINLFPGAVLLTALSGMIYAVGLLLKDMDKLGGGWENFVYAVQIRGHQLGNFFDELWTNFKIWNYRAVQEVTKNLQSIPVIGEAIFGAVNQNASTGLAAAEDHLAWLTRQADHMERLFDPTYRDSLKEVDPRYLSPNNVPSQQILIDVSQDISTSDPVVAANAANRGIARAVTEATAQAGTPTAGWNIGMGLPLGLQPR